LKDASDWFDPYRRLWEPTKTEGHDKPPAP
jgi:hypothetical protein